MIVDRRFRGASLMMEAVRTSETSVDNHSTRQYNPEESSEHHTRRRENLKSHTILTLFSLASRPFSLALASLLRFLNHIQLDAR
jgi:hypothetical protein